VFLKIIENRNFYLHLPYKMIFIVQTIIHVTNNSYMISVYTALHCNIYDDNCDCLACTVC